MYALGPNKINTLMIIFKDEAREKMTVSFPVGKKAQEAFASIIAIEGIERKEVKKYYYFEGTPYSPDQYERYWDIEKDEMEEKGIAIDFKITEFRKHREILLKQLDREFMLSLESDEEESLEMKRHIIDVKNFLRNATDFLYPHLSDLTIPQIVHFNCFNNIFNIWTIEEGSGYINIPTVTVEKPNGKFPGMPLEVIPQVKDGKVSLTIVQIGSGYNTSPKITISAPDEPDGKQAKAVALDPENDMFDYISDRETRFFGE